ncbi:MAG: hypothetical protein ACD_58C00228G0003 [uncultured bacterium]|nr:MAG: hypothetical protein ACD_58C00228G0003 [uncultured bacterium]KKQ79472.1 MAG: hypothetical protein UT02_C0035G0004 [Parcubacteria group bacterium GW2011_GWC2_38_7]
MSKYTTKYKASGLILIVLIVLLVLGAVFVDLTYFKVKKNELEKVSAIKLTDQEIEALNQVKTWTIDNPDYKKLMLINPAPSVKVAPTAKANPFINKDQKE